MNKLNSGETSEVKISCSLQAFPTNQGDLKDFELSGDYGLMQLKVAALNLKDLDVVAVRNDKNRYQSAEQKILEESKE